MSLSGMTGWGASVFKQIGSFDEAMAEVEARHRQRLAFPSVFREAEEGGWPSDLAVVAQQSAAYRERMGEVVSQARFALAAAVAMVTALERDIEDDFDRSVMGQAKRAIAEGTAWQERKASASLAVLDRRIELRGYELRLAAAKAQVRELEDCYEAWRQTEWALDRQVRLLQLRSALGEV